MTAMTHMFRMTSTMAASQVTFIGTGLDALAGTTPVLSGVPNLVQPLPANSAGDPSGVRHQERTGWLHSKRNANDRRSFAKQRMSYPRCKTLMTAN